MREALNQAMAEEMERDENVYLMGEEVGVYQGAYKVSAGLLQRFGEKRVIDTPITEAGFTGIGIGSAMTGLRPIVEMMTFNFSILAMDQIFNNLAKIRYMSGGQFKMPMVIRGPNGAAHGLGATHSQSFETVYAHFPGLYVIAPSTPSDMKGLLKSAIRDDNPVIFMESEVMYGQKGEVPEEEYTIPIGVGDVKRKGSDVTIVTWSKMVYLCLEAADRLKDEEGIEVEIVDPRTIRPLDEDIIIDSVKKTNRLVIVEEGWPFGSIGSEIASRVYYKALDYLDAPVERVNQEDVPLPYARNLEKASLPSVSRIIDAVKKVMYLQ